MVKSYISDETKLNIPKNMKHISKSMGRFLIASYLLVSTSSYGQHRSDAEYEALLKESEAELLEKKATDTKLVERYFETVDQQIDEYERQLIRQKRLEDTEFILLALLSFTVLSLLYFLYELYRGRKTVQALGEQQGVLKNMLSKLLPESVLDEIVQNGTIDPTIWENCVVLFINVQNQRPYKDVNERIEIMDTMFGTADNLFAEYGLVKIKSSGSQLLAVCKSYRLTPQQQLEKSLSCLRKLRIAASRIEKVDLVLHMGMDYGDVVSGIIGQEKMRFDVWGNTVNKAARNMEYAEPNSINASKRAVHFMNKRENDIHYLGDVEVKNSRTVEMYTLT